MLTIVRQLSQVKDKEEYASLESFENATSMPVQYAVAHIPGKSAGYPHSSSASNIADLDFVMGSQVRIGSPVMMRFTVGKRFLP